jgi:hypothetical protein
MRDSEEWDMLNIRVMLWLIGHDMVLLKFQNYSYYPIMMLARFNLYVLSWEYLLKGQGEGR